MEKEIKLAYYQGIYAKELNSEKKKRKVKRNPEFFGPNEVRLAIETNNKKYFINNQLNTSVPLRILCWCDKEEVLGKLNEQELEQRYNDEYLWDLDIDVSVDELWKMYLFIKGVVILKCPLTSFSGAFPQSAKDVLSLADEVIGLYWVGKSVLRFPPIEYIKMLSAAYTNDGDAGLTSSSNKIATLMTTFLGDFLVEKRPPKKGEMALFYDKVVECTTDEPTTEQYSYTIIAAGSNANLNLPRFYESNLEIVLRGFNLCADVEIKNEVDGRIEIVRYTTLPKNILPNTF